MNKAVTDISQYFNNVWHHKNTLVNWGREKDYQFNTFTKFTDKHNYMIVVILIYYNRDLKHTRLKLISLLDNSKSTNVIKILFNQSYNINIERYVSFVCNCIG